MSSPEEKKVSKRIQERYNVFYLLVGLFLISVSGAYLLHRYPLRISPASNPEQAARFILQDRSSQVLLLVDTVVVSHSWSKRKLSLADFSYGWTNTLEQEFGFFDILELRAIDSEVLASAKILVCSESALEGLAEFSDGIDLIRGFVSSGGVVVLDYPQMELLAALGVAVEASETSVAKLSAGELKTILVESSINGTQSSIPDSLPLFSALRTYTLSVGRLSSSLQSYSCFDYLRVGAGGILLTKWNFGRWVTLTQQGRPSEDLFLENRYSDSGHSDKIETNDLVADVTYLDNVYPWVDIIEKSLGNFLADLVTAPRWHTAPGVSSGIFMMTHDDEGLGDAGAWMNFYEQQHGYRSTSFLMPSEKLSAKGVLAVTEAGGEIGLHWNRFGRADKATLETIGVGRWRPIVRQRKLSSQLSWLDSLGAHTTFNRNHYFLWGEDPFQVFRELSAAGFTMDYSYGPDLRDKGYLFGCGFPFNPLDDNGASFELREIPVTWTENFAGADSAWIHQILAENGAQYHGVVNALYHNNTFAWSPDYSIFESWRLSYELAKNSGHAILSAGELERFLEGRSNSSINWQSNSESVEVYCSVSDADLALVVPKPGLRSPQVSNHESGSNFRESVVMIDSVSILGAMHWRMVMPAGKFLLSFERYAVAGGGK